VALARTERPLSRGRNSALNKRARRPPSCGPAMAMVADAQTLLRMSACSIGFYVSHCPFSSSDPSEGVPDTVP
jgi:hypothetical protein